jgi:hypothetical protein
MCLGGLLRGRCCDEKRIVVKEDVIVPLTGASAVVTIVDFVAQVVIKQRYENKVCILVYFEFFPTNLFLLKKHRFISISLKRALTKSI